MSYAQRILVSIVAVVIVVGIILYAALWFTGPTRAAKQFAEALETQNLEEAQSMVSESLDESDQEDINFFLEDWNESGVPQVTIEEIESWRERPSDDGEKTEVVPTSKYWAHASKVSMNVEFEDYEDPVVVTFTRKTDNTWSPLAQLFKGYAITGISYQGEEDLDEELEFEEEFEDEDATQLEGSEDADQLDTEGMTEEELEDIEAEDETSNANAEAENASEDDTGDEDSEVFEGGLIEQ